VDNCISCKVPSDFPLLENGRCVSSCSDGHFKTNTGYCFSCYGGCVDCNDASSNCEECGNDLILIDGECYEGIDCPGDLVLVDNTCA